MTWDLWKQKLRDFVTGRTGYESTQQPLMPAQVELPPIETPAPAPADPREREHFERRRLEHDERLARLHTITRVKLRRLNDP